MKIILIIFCAMVFYWFLIMMGIYSTRLASGNYHDDNTGCRKKELICDDGLCSVNGNCHFNNPTPCSAFTTWNMLLKGCGFMGFMSLAPVIMLCIISSTMCICHYETEKRRKMNANDDQLSEIV